MFKYVCISACLWHVVSGLINSLCHNSVCCSIWYNNVSKPQFNQDHITFPSTPQNTHTRTRERIAYTPLIKTPFAKPSHLKI